ncbi:hypothetical protein PUN4_280281 [Paraburkholderia unamae]|nr:hypothetical protein PUN4_280281 [Paraburkholderia unamae]
MFLRDSISRFASPRDAHVSRSSLAVIVASAHERGETLKRCVELCAMADVPKSA